MIQPNYYTLTFMTRSARSTRTGEAPIYARITVSGQRAEFNINRNVDPENWNTAKGMSKGRSKRDIELNKYLELIRARISEIHAQLVKDEEVINPVVLKNHYLGNIAGPRMLVETFNGVVAQYKEKLEMGDICECTFLRWERCGKYLSEFLSKRERMPDIPIKKLTSGMIDDFEHFLRVTKENGNNASSLGASSDRAFTTSVDGKTITQKNTIAAVVAGDQSAISGQSVKLCLTEPMWVGNSLIPRNTVIVGQARLQGERLEVEISSIEANGSVYEVDLQVFDSDGQEVINIPNSMESDAIHEIGANMGSTMGSSINLTTNTGAQIASDVGRGLINGVSQYLNKKLRTVKVHLKSGYKVMLYQPDDT